ncbi:MAG: hypothetical protein JWP35_2080, partial [Caulobacter sp.]|nr:hypothetical protein [Caulobacter sp.]
PVAPVAPVAPPAPPPLSGFVHDAHVDVQGYYMPASEVKVGVFRLTNLTLGAPSDFSQWEADKRMATYGPVLIEFEDVTSATQTNEMGGEAHTGAIRVLPDSYRMDAKGVSFRGHAAGLGEVTFDGVFDPKALAASKGGGSAEAVVLRGTLRIGQTEFKNVAFTYFAGD